MMPSHGLPARDRARSSGHRRPARHPGNRSPVGKPGHPPRRRRPGPVRPRAPLGGSPTQGDPVLPCPSFSRTGSAATPHRSDRLPAQAICLGIRVSAEVPVHQIPSDSPNPHGLHVKTPALCQPLAQTLRPNIGPVLLDVVQTSGASPLAVKPPPASKTVSKGRPQAALLLVVNQDEKLPLSSSNGLMLT